MLGLGCGFSGRQVAYALVLRGQIECFSLFLLTKKGVKVDLVHVK